MTTTGSPAATPARPGEGEGLSARVERLERCFPQTLVALPSGERIAVRTAGSRSAPVIVALHGIGSGAGSWFDVAEALAPVAHFVAWEAPGYGDSSPCTTALRQAQGEREGGGVSLFDPVRAEPVEASSHTGDQALRQAQGEREGGGVSLSDPVRAELVEATSHTGGQALRQARGEREGGGVSLSDPVRAELVEATSHTGGQALRQAQGEREGGGVSLSRPVRAEPVEALPRSHADMAPDAQVANAEAIAYAARLEEALTALGIESFVLVGHSLGALVAAAYATGPAAAKVRRLVLISPAVGYGAPERADERAQVRARRLASLAERGIAGIAEDAPQRMLSAAAGPAARAWVQRVAASLNPAGYARAIELLCDGDIARAAGRLSMPCEVLVGAADAITPPDACRAIADRLGARFALIPEAGHASPVEKPEDVARHLERAAAST